MKFKLIALSIAVLSVLVLLIGSCSQQEADQESPVAPNGRTTSEVSAATQVDEIWNNIVPEPDTITAYGIPLSLDNTQQFIDWFNTIELNEDDKELKSEVLDPLVAPCCDEYPVSEC